MSKDWEFHPILDRLFPNHNSSGMKNNEVIIRLDGEIWSKSNILSIFCSLIRDIVILNFGYYRRQFVCLHVV
ncbi:hypothetical protein ACS0TY_024258 [Phlomoides rotata]